MSKYTEVKSAGAFSKRMRQKRHLFFRSLLDRIPGPVKILDIGGTENYWKQTGEILGNRLYEITLVNMRPEKTTADNVRAFIGDATNLYNVGDKEYDVVFSNSVIEHLQSYGSQRLMAKEVLRVGKRYFVQTPNKFFPIEPHFLFPMFQFLPRSIKVALFFRFGFGWEKPADRKEAGQIVDSIKLLSERDFRQLFPQGRIYREKYLGLTKSFIAYGGWDTEG